MTRPTDGYYGGYRIVDGEKWWSECVVQSAEERARRGPQEERAAIVRWLRESVASGPATLLAEQIEQGDHRDDEQD